MESPMRFTVILVFLLIGLPWCNAGKPTTLDTEDNDKKYLNDQSKLSMDSKSFKISTQQDPQEWTREVIVHLLSLSEQMNNKLGSMQTQMECLDRDVKELKSDVESIRGELQDVKTQTITASSALKDEITGRIGSEMSHVVDKFELLQYRRAGEKKKEDKDTGLSLSEVTQELSKFSDHITDNFTHTIDRLRRDVDCGEHGTPEDAYNSSTESNNESVLLTKIDKLFGDLDAERLDKENTDGITGQGQTLNETMLSDAIVRNIEGVLRKALMQTKCVRGMVAAPYSIVNPSSSDVINKPYVCDSHTTGGGWIVFQKRQSGRVSFDRNWKDYKNGFGELNDDHWLGLDAIHQVTRSGTYELRIDLVAREKRYYAEYNFFAVASEADNYILQLGNYTGTAGDKMSYHRWMAFTTTDRDNDKSSSNCGAGMDSGWWYNSCYQSDLNDDLPTNGGIEWNGLSSITFTEMKMRKVKG